MPRSDMRLAQSMATQHLQHIRYFTLRQQQLPYFHLKFNAAVLTPNSLSSIQQTPRSTDLYQLTSPIFTPHSPAILSPKSRSRAYNSPPLVPILSQMNPVNTSTPYLRHPCNTGGRDSSVGIATRYGIDGPGIESRWRRDFPNPSKPTLGPTMGTGSFSGVNRPGRGAD